LGLAQRADLHPSGHERVRTTIFGLRSEASCADLTGSPRPAFGTFRRSRSGRVVRDAEGCAGLGVPRDHQTPARSPSAALWIGWLETMGSRGSGNRWSLWSEPFSPSPTAAFRGPNPI